MGKLSISNTVWQMKIPTNDSDCGREGSKWTAAAEMWFSYSVVTDNRHGNDQSSCSRPLRALCVVVKFSIRNKKERELCKAIRVTHLQYSMEYLFNISFLLFVIRHTLLSKFRVSTFFLKKWTLLFSKDALCWAKVSVKTFIKELYFKLSFLKYLYFPNIPE